MSGIAGNHPIRAKTSVPQRVSTPRKTRQTRQFGSKLLITLTNLLSGLFSEGQKPDIETRQIGRPRPIILRPRPPYLDHQVRPEEVRCAACGGHPCWSPRSVFGLLEFPDSGQWTPADSSRAVVSWGSAGLPPDPPANRGPPPERACRPPLNRDTRPQNPNIRCDLLWATSIHPRTASRRILEPTLAGLRRESQGAPDQMSLASAALR